MYNSIVVSSCLFGSIYIFSKTLIQINKLLLLNYKKINYDLLIINSLTLVISGSVFVFGVTLIKL
jgi:hypothetical protein